MGLRRALTVFFADAVVGFRKHRTALVFFYFSSKKVMLVRWKEVSDGLVLKSCEVYNFNFH